MTKLYTAFIKCLAAPMLLTACFATLKAAKAAAPQHKVTYWKKLIVSHRMDGITIVTLTYYSSMPNGPVMSESLLNGKFSQYLLAPHGMGGLFWTEAGNKAALNIFSLVKLVKLRSSQIGYNRVKQLSGWPSDIHPFTLNPNFKPAPPPPFYASKTTASIGSLKKTGAAVFEGHKCLILQQHSQNLGNAGKQIDRFWWDVQTHYIWKEEDIIYPPANSPTPPTRRVTYVKWVRPMKRTPAEVFRFPAATKVLVPGILGSLAVPPGGIKVKPPASRSYLGCDLSPEIRSLESVKGTKNETHYALPGHVPTPNHKRN